jgi:putative hemolysin
MEYEIALTGILILMLVFIATFESAFGQLSDVALRALTAEGKSKAHASFLRQLLEHHQLFWMTVLSGLQVAAVTIALLLVSIGQRLGLSLFQSLLASLVISMLIGALFGQFLPRLFTQNQPAKVLLLLLPAFALYHKIFSLPARIVYRVLQYFREERTTVPQDVEETTTDDIQALLEVGTEEGIIEEAESKLIHSVIEFTDTTVDEVMTPRTEMVALEATASIDQMRDLMTDSHHSRVPIYRESVDNVEGVVYIHDVMSAWRDQRNKDAVSTIARPVYFVPETKPVAALLAEMQRSKRQIALVVDEYGVTAGLVTIKDLIEEIVGEIEQEEGDKGSPQEREIVENGDGTYMVKGNTEIRKLELLFDKELEADDFSTVAGFIIKNVGRVPNVGETFSYRGVWAEIIEADSGRISRVRVRPTEEPETTKTNGNGKS